MIYEDMTYEVILERMIDRVSEQYPNLDTREGSIIFNALAPAALELAIMYTELDNAIAESFVNTASREYILQHCEQMGMDISVFEATYGVHKALFDVEVSIGSRWNCDLHNYVVSEYIGKENEYHAYKMICETEGSTANNNIGTLTAIDDLPEDLTYSELVECLIEGENETSDEDIKTAYYQYVNDTRTDGNVAQYEQWCEEFDGIGNYKILPLPNDVANTVKVSILSASNRKASDELISKFQNYLDPGVKGMGDGKAPIGAFVTVSTATEKAISVSADVTLKSGYTDPSPISTAISNYFTEISYKKNAKPIVPYMTLGAEILKVECVEGIANLKVNGGTSDVSLGAEEIPIVGTLNWSVV